MIVYVSEKPPARSVKISADERTGWSSERPRADGAPPRPVDVSVRCRVLAPSHRLRYSPGSLLVIVGAEASEPARFAERVVEERGAVLAPARVRALLAGRVAESEIEERASELWLARFASGCSLNRASFCRSRVSTPHSANDTSVSRMASVGRDT